MSAAGGRPLALGVNIDHVATLRQARGVAYPDPVEAALVAEANGADSITVHLREDRRHIQEHDVHRLRERIATHLNLEMAVTPSMLEFCLRVAPRDCCLVPERRLEVTTEGGLDVVGQHEVVRAACGKLAAGGIRVALFVDPDPRQIEAAVEVGAPVVELHTGAYAAHPTEAELGRLRAAARQALAAGLTVHAGHGLSVANVAPVAAIPELVELNIGHAIVARAVFVGLGVAVAEMKLALAEARA